MNKGWRRTTMGQLLAAGIGGMVPVIVLLTMAHISKGDPGDTAIAPRRRILIPRPGLGSDSITRQDANTNHWDPAVVASLTHKPLIISAEGSQTTNFGEIARPASYDLPTDGQIWMVLTTGGNQPLVGANPEDIKITVLSGQHEGEPSVNRALSKPQLGLWNITLPRLHSGNHFYLVNVSAIDQHTGNTYDGQQVVRAVHSTVLVLSGRRPDGTMWWNPPGGG